MKTAEIEALIEKGTTEFAVATGYIGRARLGGDLSKATVIATRVPTHDQRRMLREAAPDSPDWRGSTLRTSAIVADVEHRSRYRDEVTVQRMALTPQRFFGTWEEHERIVRERAEMQAKQDDLREQVKAMVEAKAVEHGINLRLYEGYDTLILARMVEREQTITQVQEHVYILDDEYASHTSLYLHVQHDDRVIAAAGSSHVTTRTTTSRCLYVHLALCGALPGAISEDV